MRRSMVWRNWRAPALDRRVSTRPGSCAAKRPLSSWILSHRPHYPVEHLSFAHAKEISFAPSMTSGGSALSEPGGFVLLQMEGSQMRYKQSGKLRFLFGAALSSSLLAAMGVPSEAQTLPAGCQRQLTANVVALDQVFFYNRLGAQNPAGMIYALRRDVVDVATGRTEAQGGVLTAGRVALRPDKRPRPLVLRVNDNQPITRNVGLHVTGLQLVTSIADDGSNVGANASSLAAPGQTRTYKLFAERESMYFLYSPAAQTGAEGDGGTLAFGL